MKWNKEKPFHLISDIQMHWYRRWNVFKFRYLGVQLGRNAELTNKIILRCVGGGILIGNDLTIRSCDTINPLCRNVIAFIRVEQGAVLTIGNSVGMSSPCIWVKESVTIGNHVNLGGNVTIIDSDIHSLDWQKRRNEFMIGVAGLNAPVSIEDDVWIGANTLILKGVSIGARSIIGAGSVVTKSIPADCIAAGNPCKVIKHINRE